MRPGETIKRTRVLLPAVFFNFIQSYYLKYRHTRIHPWQVCSSEKVTVHPLSPSGDTPPCSRSRQTLRCLDSKRFFLHWVFQRTSAHEDDTRYSIQIYGTERSGSSFVCTDMEQPIVKEYGTSLQPFFFFFCLFARPPRVILLTSKTQMW